MHMCLCECGVWLSGKEGKDIRLYIETKLVCRARDAHVAKQAAKPSRTLQSLTSVAGNYRARNKR